MPPELEPSINELMVLSGKSREMCIQALRAAQNIPDIAFEFLMSGHIPQAPADQEGANADYGDEGDDGEGAGLEGLNVSPEVLQQIQALVSNPSFPMIRQRMLQDPAFSAQFLQQLQTTQPQIYQAFQQNPSLLMTLLLGHDPTSALGQGGMPGMGGMPSGQ